MPDTKKSTEIPVTQKMLNEVKQELKHEITSVALEVRSLDKKMDSRFAEMDSKFAAMDSRFSEMDSKFAAIDSRFSEMDSKFVAIDSRFSSMDSRFLGIESQLQLVLAEIRKVSASVEEQNSRNRYVLDGYASLNARVEALENQDH